MEQGHNGLSVFRSPLFGNEYAETAGSSEAFDAGVMVTTIELRLGPALAPAIVSERSCPVK
jgi:hypothetical protein